LTEKDAAKSLSPKIELLVKKHDRAFFSCGNDASDTYLKKRASQEAKKKIATTFVMVGNQPTEILGYYTLSATSILLDDLPDKISKKLPKYPQVPATLLGRLAVDSRHQGRGYGEILILDALRRSLNAATVVASYAVVVDAIDGHARSLYVHYGFCVFSDRKLRLFMPMKTIADLFS